MTNKVLDVNSDCHELIEAYQGYYEDAIESVEDKRAWAVRKILADSPKERLHVYLEWNGILGYTESIYKVAASAMIAI